MSPYAIFVTIKVKSGTAEKLRALIVKNAQAARAREPDCRAFFVSTAENEPETFHFFEVYSTKAALEAHRQQPHFLEYFAAAKDLMVSRTVQGMEVVDG
ncbi:MAG: antibiotic biosynthesis monooxygenase [Rhodospirillales bacterium]|nr:antibiotic biosynthesis monooxygenase [Rhodospirillales bacterium]